MAKPVERQLKVRCMPVLEEHVQHVCGKQACIGEQNPNVKVTFGKPVRAATPGQSAVFYDAEGCVIGGGRIV